MNDSAEPSSQSAPGVAPDDTSTAKQAVSDELRSDVSQAAAQAHEEANAKTAGRRVVVAEDEAIIRMDIVEILRDSGYEVVAEAGDGEAAVAAVREHKPDLVVMDVKMPVMDGITAAETISRERLAPVVMLTAFSQTELVERARDAGAMAYVVKPFSASDLLPAAEIALSRHAEITALESEVADLQERFEIRKQVERAKGLLMSAMGMSEPEAFRWIQKTSMDRRLSMREVAEVVLTQVKPKDKPKRM
ncbi:MAG: response regulator [Micrococcales bacterium]|nr:MAG: response regulator [Micrococcales bacterium]